METDKKIHQIYDKMFKKILTLSSTAVINMINGLFHTDYPIDSTITYNWTEFEDDALRKVLADTIITINGVHSYHMEVNDRWSELINSHKMMLIFISLQMKERDGAV